MKFKFLLTSIFVLLLFCGCQEQQSAEPSVHGRKKIHNDNKTHSELYYLLAQKDSLMFELSYNQLDTSILEELAMDDIEFYHDQAGATYTQTDFIEGMKGLGNLSYKARRELVPGSLEIFPMYNNGEVYAAILKGEHRFYAKEPNEKPEFLTSKAKYTVLWVLSEGQWKMSRIYSYDHQSPD